MIAFKATDSAVGRWKITEKIQFPVKNSTTFIDLGFFPHFF